MKDKMQRRDFLKTSTAAGLAAGLSQMAVPLRAAHHGSAMNTVRVAAVGTNSRGNQLVKLFARVPGVKITHVCDPDQKAIAKGVKTAVEMGQDNPVGVKDFRTLLDRKDVDAFFMATPDHWHAPGAILAMQAGKHVYLEKPISHNPAEGEMVMRAEKRSGVVFQLGVQRRSGDIYFQAKEEIQNGVIGRPYLGQTWYSNARKAIGRGRHMSIPSHLDYDVWQGPAARRLYRDNVIHYNWHWFKNWGTGEINNNATHEVDVARWLMGLSIPSRVTSSGGRFHYDDDWEFFDTQEANWEFPGGSLINWSGRSCNRFYLEGEGRGCVIQGTEGSLSIDPGKYTVFDLRGDRVKTETLGGQVSEGGGTNTVAPTEDLTYAHVLNFIESIRGQAKANAPAREGHHTNLLCHLGNIAQFLGRSLNIDPATGRILGDPEAMASWEREYEPGWKPSV
jgi:predicted dehydrogenase